MFAGGICGDLIDRTEWSATTLGRISDWPASLKTIVGTMLASRHPMFLWWGPELIQFYNDAYLPSFGVGKHPAAMGQRGRDCWGEIWPIIWPQIDDAMTRGRASWNEDHLVPIFRNGRIEEVYWTYGYSPVRDDRGQIAGTLVVCTETTARVIAERRLDVMRRLSDATANAESVAAISEHVLTIAQSAPLDIPFASTYHADRATRRVRVDPSTENVIDAAVTSALGGPAQSLVELRPPVLAPGVPWPEPCTHVWVLRPRTAGLGVFAFGVSPRLPADEAYRHFCEDFVEQLDASAARIEAFLARAAAELERRNLLMQAPVPAALLTGPEHRYELANAAYLQMVGGRPVIGKPHVEAFPELVGTPILATIDRVYETGEGFSVDEHRALLDLHGEGPSADRFYKLSLEPIRDGSGSVYGIILVAIEITEQVRARRVLERINDERQRLLQELESAGRAKDEFLATISHELRTPLTAMLGWARVLQEEESDHERIRKGLAVIERNATVQAQLIEDILDVSRIVAGKVRLSMRRVNVAVVINAAVETTRPTAVAKDVRIAVELQPDLGEIVADEDRLQQIVWNLLSNAVKFSKKGGTVFVRGTRTSAQLEIFVRDEGKGITPSFLPQVFDRFRQDDASTTKQAGLGLGLAIVRHLVEMHGGTVTASSEGEGRGATFQVSLPLQVLGAVPEHADRSSADHTAPSAQLLAAISVLVVDDQNDSRELVSTVLSDVGASVKQASSVAMAFEVLADFDAHVIVSDIGMPGEDGYRFLQRLRASEVPSHRDIPAIALSAYARAEDRDRAVAAGFHEYASKPIDPRKLVKLVAIAAGHRKR